MVEVSLDKSKLDSRYAELREQYTASCKGVSVNGTALSPSYAQLVRTTTRKELDILQLVRCLMGSKESYQLTNSAIQGWLRLVEPNKRHGGVGARCR